MGQKSPSQLEGNNSPEDEDSNLSDSESDPPVELLERDTTFGGAFSGDANAELTCYFWGTSSLSLHLSRRVIVSSLPRKIDNATWMAMFDTNLCISSFVLLNHGMSAVYDEKGELYSFGYAPLGNGNELSFVKPVKIGAFDAETIVNVSGGYKNRSTTGHVLFLAENGRLFGCGDNRYFQACGEDLVVDSLRSPVRVGERTYCDMACGLKFSGAILSARKKMLSFGFAQRGCLGNELKEWKYKKSKPVKVTRLPRKSDWTIAAYCPGWGHCLALTKSSDGTESTVFVWGHNSEGQHGDASQSTKPDLDHESPEEIVFFRQKSIVVERIASGHAHCAAISEFGELYMWGLNIDGRCGVPVDTGFHRGESEHSNVLLPTLVIMPTGSGASWVCMSVSCATMHTLALFEDMVGGRRACFSWGTGQDGELGHGHREDGGDGPEEVVLEKYTVEGEEDSEMVVVAVHACRSLSFCVCSRRKTGERDLRDMKIQLLRDLLAL